MELRQLTYFIAVAEELHFGRAAKRVHIAQPPLSQQIKKLEEELGAKLFERTSREVKVTPEGRAFLKKARTILREVDEAAQTVQNIANGETGRLSIGFVGAAINSNLPNALLKYRANYPAVTLQLKEMGTNDQFHQMGQEKLDAGFYTPGREEPEWVESIPFFSERHILCLPEAHPLADMDKVPLEDLKDTPLVMFPRSSNPLLFDKFHSCFDKAGYTPNTAQEVAGPMTITALVKAGLGAAFVPASVRNIPRKGVVYKKVIGDLPDSIIYLGWRKDRHFPALNNFIQTMTYQTFG
ncbi:MAG: LysR family transcriptional regulator [Desulfovibrio sp.]